MLHSAQSERCARRCYLCNCLAWAGVCLVDVSLLQALPRLPSQVVPNVGVGVATSKVSLVLLCALGFGSAVSATGYDRQSGILVGSGAYGANPGVFVGRRQGKVRSSRSRLVVPDGSVSPGRGRRRPSVSGRVSCRQGAPSFGGNFQLCPCLSEAGSATSDGAALFAASVGDRAAMAAPAAQVPDKGRVTLRRRGHVWFLEHHGTGERVALGFESGARELEFSSAGEGVLIIPQRILYS